MSFKSESMSGGLAAMPAHEKSDSENQPNDQFDTSAKDSSKSISEKYSCSNEL